jgi:hypothetical protein
LTNESKRLPYRMEVRDIYLVPLLDSGVRPLSNRVGFEFMTSTSSMLLREVVFEVLSADIDSDIAATVSV